MYCYLDMDSDLGEKSGLVGACLGGADEALHATVHGQHVSMQQVQELFR